MSTKNSSTIINTESWFIPFDIIMILSTGIAVILATFFLITIIINKTCHTVPMMLVANSCLIELIFGSDMFGNALFTLVNDLKQIEYQDSLCVFRAYVGYTFCALQNYSYLLQAVYRYVTVVYPTHLYWQSTKIQSILILLLWIFGFIFAIPSVVNDEAKYNVNNQICQASLRLSFIMFYNGILIYAVPISITMLIYLKLVRYVREMRKHVISAITLHRAQRDLKMVRRILSLIMSLATVGFPYLIFILISFFTTPPRYHFRIAYLFVDISLAFVMIALFQFNEPFKTFVTKKVYWKTNTVLPTIA